MPKVGAHAKPATSAAPKKKAAKKASTKKKAAPLDVVEAAPRKKSSAVSPPPTAIVLDALAVPSSFPLGKLAEISTPTSAGQVFRLDGGLLDALRLQVRRIATEKGPGYSIDFALCGPARAGFEARLEKLGAERAAYSFHEAKPTKKGGQTTLVRSTKTQPLGSSYYTHAAPGMGSSPHEALSLEVGGAKLEFVPASGPLALRGAVRITLDAKGGDAALEALLNKTGLGAAFAPPTKQSLDRYLRMKLLWRTDPAAAKALAKGKTDLSAIKLADIDAKLSAAGISAERIGGLRFEEVAPGHFAPYDEAAAAEMQKAGAAFAYSTVSTPEHVLSILEHGQKSTLTRWTEGALIEGMSSMADLGTGGGIGVFSRLVVPEADKKSWTGRTYKIVLDPSIFGRLDIWGWPSDMFGRGWDLGEKNFGAGLVKEVRKVEGQNKVTSGSAWPPSGSTNEIISPFGNGPRWIRAVVATSEDDRKKLLAHLKKHGFTPPGGGKLESFVRLEPKIRGALLD